MVYILDLILINKLLFNKDVGIRVGLNDVNVLRNYIQDILRNPIVKENEQTWERLHNTRLAEGEEIPIYKNTGEYLRYLLNNAIEIDENKNIVSLNLFGYGITEFPEYSIKLNQLQRLYLQGYFTELPCSLLKKLLKLKSLYFNSNFPLEIKLNQFENLINIDRLAITSYQSITLPKGIVLPRNLTYLIIHPFQRINLDLIHSLPNLKTLSIVIDYNNMDIIKDLIGTPNLMMYIMPLSIEEIDEGIDIFTEIKTMRDAYSSKFDKLIMSKSFFKLKEPDYDQTLQYWK